MNFRVERLNTIDDNNVSLELIQEEYFYIGVVLYEKNWFI